MAKRRTIRRVAIAGMTAAVAFTGMAVFPNAAMAMTQEGEVSGHRGDEVKVVVRNDVFGTRGAWVINAPEGASILSTETSVPSGYVPFNCTTTPAKVTCPDTGIQWGNGNKVIMTMKINQDAPLGVMTGTSAIGSAESGTYDIEVVSKLTAQVSSVDPVARTADLTGTAEPGSTILINENDQFVVGEDGKWTYTVLGLNLTTNDIKIEQYEGPGNQTAETTVTADLSLAAVTATASFLPDMKQNMVISGVGQPGADIEIWQGDKMLRTVTANAISGHFSMDVAAPNAGGAQTYTIKQTLNGVTSPTEYTVNADFGRAVSIETPLEGSTTPGGTVTFQGRGVPGAEVVVREKGKTEALQTGAALVNGVWTLRVPGISATEATYVVTQTGPGNNVTTAEVTLNPGTSNEQLDVVAPAQGASVDAGIVTFSGTANAGAKVELYSLTSGASLGTATAAANGTWSADVNRSLSAGTYTIGVRNGGLDVKRTFTVKNPVVEQLDVITPARGAIVDPGTVTFSGTANANADIELYSITSGASLGTTKANASGAWTVAVNKQLGEGHYTIGVRNGSLQEQRTFTVQNPVVDQLDVTTPAQHGEVAPGTVTFTGTSNANANIELRSIATGGLLGSGKATAAGAWSVNVNKTLAEGTYSIKVVNGSQEVVRAFTVKRPVVADLDVLTPAQNATVAAGTVTFTGTANANAEIELRSITTGALLGSGTANAAGDWTVDVNKQLGAANYVIRVVNDNVEVDRAFQVR